MEAKELLDQRFFGYCMVVTVLIHCVKTKCWADIRKWVDIGIDRRHFCRSTGMYLTIAWIFSQINYYRWAFGMREHRTMTDRCHALPLRDL